MRNYAKIGGRKERPAYRTPACFRVRQRQKINRLKISATKEKQKKKYEFNN